MKQFVNAALVAVVVLGICRYAKAADSTATATIGEGFTGNDIAAEFGNNAWSQGTEFDCTFSNNTLSVTDKTGDCEEPRSHYTFEPDPCPVEEEHTMSLRVQCSSTVASIDFDGQGFVTLAAGPNVFVSGADTITINFSLPKPGLVGRSRALHLPIPAGVPTVPEWGLVTLGAPVLCMGVLLLGRGRAV